VHIKIVKEIRNVKEMRKKLDVMEAKLDAVCSGECPLKLGKAQTNR